MLRCEEAAIAGGNKKRLETRMIKKILLGVTFCISLSSNAQNYTLEIGKNVEDDVKFLSTYATGFKGLQKVIYSSGNNKVVETTEVKYGLKFSKFLVSIVNNKLVAHAEFPYSYQKPISFHKIGSKFYVQQTIKNKKMWQATLNEIDLSTLKVETIPALAIHESLKKSSPMNGLITSSTSNNNLNYACLIGDNNSNYQVKMYNKDLSETWNHSFTLENISPSAYVTATPIITNEGTVILHLSVIEENTIMAAYVSNCSVNVAEQNYLVIVDAKGVRFLEEIKLEGKYIVDLNVKMLNQNTVGLIGGFGDSKKIKSSFDSQKEGIIAVVYDLNKHQVTLQKESKFSLDLLEEMYPEEKYYTKAGQILFNIADFHLTSDGNIYIIGQRVTFSAQKDINTNVVSNAKYMGHELVVLSLDSKGDFNWGRSFEFERQNEYDYSKHGIKTLISFITPKNDLVMVYNRTHLNRPSLPDNCFTVDISPDGDKAIKNISLKESFVLGSAVWESQDEVSFLLQDYNRNHISYKSARIKVLP